MLQRAVQRKFLILERSVATLARELVQKAVRHIRPAKNAVAAVRFNIARELVFSELLA